MVEAIGLGLSVVALAGLFNNAVDSYEYVRLGQQYGRDFNVSQTKLDLSRLQLSRWGIASATEIKQAEDTLEVILRLLDDAHALSEKFTARSKPEDATTLEALESSSSLHQKISSMVNGRHRRGSLRKKTAWALYGKKDLDRLVGDIAEMTTSLIELFPSTAARQHELCKYEVQEMDDQSLSLVEEVASSQDPLLASTAHAALQSRGHYFNRPHACDGAAMHASDFIHADYRGQLGDMSHTFDNAKAEGKGTRQHLGNHYGGTSDSTLARTSLPTSTSE